jgi:hypothetical protein
MLEVRSTRRSLSRKRRTCFSLLLNIQQGEIE